MKDLEEPNPIEVAEDAIANQLQIEPAFKWWVGHVLRKNGLLCSAVDARIRKPTHEYGVHVLRSM